MTMEMIKEGAIGDELKIQHGNFSFKAATTESHNVLVADQLFIVTWFKKKSTIISKGQCFGGPLTLIATSHSSSVPL